MHPGRANPEPLTGGEAHGLVQTRGRRARACAAWSPSTARALPDAREREKGRGEADAHPGARELIDEGGDAGEVLNRVGELWPASGEKPIPATIPRFMR